MQIWLGASQGGNGKFGKEMMQRAAIGDRRWLCGYRMGWKLRQPLYQCREKNRVDGLAQLVVTENNRICGFIG